MNILRALGKLKAIAASQIGGPLIDPIEVFYELATDRVYPIISKSGNSSLKRLLINKYNPTYTAGFPEIHLDDPSPLTNGQIERRYFSTQKDYYAFCANKTIYVVMRDPVARYYSFYLGVRSRRNLIYRYPSQTHRLFRITSNLNLPQLLRRTAFLPDRIADRHFRSQSFYVPQEVYETAAAVEVHDMPVYLRAAAGAVNRETMVKLNDSKLTDTETELSLIRNSTYFTRRYAEDLALYRTITTLPSPRAKN